ncbi:unnamed protein product [Mortierella alpina]
MKFPLFPLVVAVVAAAVSASSAENPGGGKPANDKVVIGYYSPSNDIKVADLEMEKYTHINYAYGRLLRDQNVSIATIHFDGHFVHQLVKRGKVAGIPILMSIGGWSGSQTFSEVAADPVLRKTFVENAINLLRNTTNGYDMDGIDISWEFPGHRQSSSKCNTVSKDDGDNFRLLVKELRQQLDNEFPDNRKLLTAAVRIIPIDDEAGAPARNVSDFVNDLDWISVMAFDMMGPWSGVINSTAPFDRGELSLETLPKYHTFSESIALWMEAGCPARKLVAGFAFYGNSMTATANMNTTTQVHHNTTEPKGDLSNRVIWNKYCDKDSTFSRGLWTWKELRTRVLMNDPTSPAEGWTRRWNNNAQTPSLFHARNNTIISYDDVESLSIKVKHVKDKDLRGVMFREISHDYNHQLTTVLNQVRCANNCSSGSTVIPPKNNSSLDSQRAKDTFLDTLASVSMESFFYIWNAGVHGVHDVLMDDPIIKYLEKSLDFLAEDTESELETEAKATMSSSSLKVSATAGAKVSPSASLVTTITNHNINTATDADHRRSKAAGKDTLDILLSKLLTALRRRCHEYLENGTAAENTREDKMLANLIAEVILRFWRVATEIGDKPVAYRTKYRSFSENTTASIDGALPANASESRSSRNVNATAKIEDAPSANARVTTHTQAPCPRTYPAIKPTPSPLDLPTHRSGDDQTVTTKTRHDDRDLGYVSPANVKEHGTCAPVLPWSSAITYRLTKFYVVYDGRLWYNQWYSHNETPAPGGVWKEIVPKN